MVALSTPSTELRCKGKDPTRPARLCNRRFALMEDRYVQVQVGGLAMECPRCGGVTRFALVEEMKEAA